MATPSITFWNRVEPRPRSNAFGPSLAAQVRDPAWFLCRQWQTGELTGQDAGSPAAITLAQTTANMASWSPTGGTPVAINNKMPLEKQALAEPFSTRDLALSVEIGQTFRKLLPANQLDPVATYQLFVTHFPLQAPTPADFDTIDTATAAFLTVCAGQALDGTAVYAFAKQFTPPNTTLPSWIPDPSKPAVLIALKALIAWVQSVWGDLADTDPTAWAPQRLEYNVQVQAEAPDGTGLVFDAHPDRTGELPWSAFDVSTATTAAPGPTPQAVRSTLVPGHVRYRSVASPRFWDFETSDLALPNVKPEPRDVGKMLTLDFMLIHGMDWFIAPLPQALGTLVRVDALVVTDVFGAQTSIGRADAGTTAPGPTRWTLFTPTTPTAVGNFFVAPPTAGSAAVAARPLESVRFARDDMANMAWGIENLTASPIGRPRPGADRDAAQDAVNPVTPPPSDDKTSPLRYQVETKVPVHWIPLLGLGNPVTGLTVAEMVRPLQPPTQGNPVQFNAVPAIGKILNPGGPSQNNQTYVIADEEVPRDGLVVERVVYRSRWIDGSRHLWIARRRRTGSGETASALRFDVASSTVT
jgi:hypothetical protein